MLKIHYRIRIFWNVRRMVGGGAGVGGGLTTRKIDGFSRIGGGGGDVHETHFFKILRNFHPGSGGSKKQWKTNGKSIFSKGSVMDFWGFHKKNKSCISHMYWHLRNAPLFRPPFKNQGLFIRFWHDFVSGSLFFSIRLGGVRNVSKNQWKINYIFQLGPDKVRTRFYRVAMQNEQRLSTFWRVCRGASTGTLDFSLYVCRFREEA